MRGVVFHCTSINGVLPCSGFTVFIFGTRSNERVLAPYHTQVWWEGLELGAADELRKRSLGGCGRPVQAGLVVCASLVDKVPNLAGLTRTCEIFGAAELIVPNIQVHPHKPRVLLVSILCALALAE